MKYIGMDVSKRFSYVTVMDEAGKIEEEGKVINEREVLIEYFNKIGPDTKVAIEATRNWYYLFETLEEKVGELHLGHPLRIKAIASARIKTDKIDSRILAHLLRTNLLPESYVPARKIRDQRELLRARSSLVRQQSQIKNKIHAMLDKNGLHCPYTDLFGVKGMGWLDKQALREVYKEELDSYLAVLDTLKQEIAEMSKMIYQQFTMSPEAKLVQTMPGVGHYLAMLIVSEIGDIIRFPDPHKLTSFAGLVPSTYSSGDITRHGRLTKLGSKHLRWGMIEAAQQAPSRSPKLSKFFNRIAKRKGRKSARAALARHMLKIIYHMLKEGQPYIEDSERSAIA